MRTIRFLAALAIVMLMLPLTARADSGGPIYMCIDEYGRRSFTNVRSEMKGRKCERQTEAPLPVTPGAKPAAKAAGTPTPADFPKVDQGTQKSRDDLRRKVLTDELGTEQKLLDKANQDLSDARTPRPGEERSSQKIVDRVREAENAVQRHRQNIESLQREISTLK